jgi:hypothetical protein
MAFSHSEVSPFAQVPQAAEKAVYFVIPNEVRNLSLGLNAGKERFLGARRASE